LLLFTALLGLLLVPLAYGYQLMLYWVPLAFIDGLVFCAAGALLFFAVGYTNRLGHGRSAGKAMLLGMFAGLVFVSAGHVLAWTIDRRLGQPAGNGFFDYLGQASSRGWSLSRRTSGRGGLRIDGAWAWVVWGVELVVLLLVGIIAGALSAAHPYCEACGRWAKKKLAEFTLNRPTPEAVTQAKEATTVEDLLTIPLDDQGNPSDALVYSVHACPACAQSATVTVVHKTTKTNLKGGTETDATSLHEYALLTVEERDLMLALAEQVARARPEA
jgi:hypothetical protein